MEAFFCTTPTPLLADLGAWGLPITGTLVFVGGIVAIVALGELLGLRYTASGQR